MDTIRVMLYGVGAISSMIAKNLLEKEGVEISCALDNAPGKVGRDLGDVLEIDRKLGVKISEDLDEALSRADVDIAIHATSSRLRQTFPQISSIAKRGVNVISTCEELVYPYEIEPELARELDKLAKKSDVTILGTGINPGFLMDTLVITLTAPCQKINTISVKRVMDAAKRRIPFQRKVGAGLSFSEFETKIERREITGHVGLEQSIALVAGALKWTLEDIRIGKPEPVVVETTKDHLEGRVEEKKVVGLKQMASGISNGKEVIKLEFQAYLGAAQEYDEITIDGVPKIRERIQPCVHGDIGTVAMIVNNIPRVISAKAGLITMKDLPIPSAVLGDLRYYCSESKG